MLFFPISTCSTNHNSKFSFGVSNQDATRARIDIFHQFLVSSISSSMGGRNIFLPGRFFPRKFPDFSGGVEEIANPVPGQYCDSLHTVSVCHIVCWVISCTCIDLHLTGIGINSLWPSDVIWGQGSRSTLAQVMACCLTAPSHYLNQCWLMISGVFWHSPDSNFTENTQKIFIVEMSLKFTNLRLVKLKSPGG